MKETTIHCLAAVALYLLYAACTTPQCTPTPYAEGFFDVDEELDRLHSCSGAKLSCGGANTLSDVETISYLSNYNFKLWSGTSNTKQFNNAEVDALLQSADSKAKSNAPQCAKSGKNKVVYDIDFATDIVVGGGGYILGMKVKYACCEGQKPH